MPHPNDLLRARIAAGKPVYLDSGTGTELERRGADMHGEVWCAAATGTHPELLQAIHVDNIRAGADIVTANTFSSNRNMLEPGGLGDRVESLNRAAVDIAIKARDEVDVSRPVIVAGSMSHQIPVEKGTDKRKVDRFKDSGTARANFEELAGILHSAGVDMILMEMMSDPDLALPAIESARAIGLPVWVGLSARRNNDGTVVSSSRPDLTFEDLVKALLPSCEGCAVVGVMHTTLEITPDAMKILRSHWNEATMVYPDLGHFEMPNWVFDPGVTPETMRTVIQQWRDEFRIDVVGGCCGMGPEFIAEMASEG